MVQRGHRLHMFKEISKENKHPLFKQKRTLGQKAADAISRFGGSWTFIIALFIFVMAWAGLNAWLLVSRPFDPYPFILLNLVLSCLAAVQAPVILMAHNRQEERDRINAHYDYIINRKAEREIQNIQQDLEDIKTMIHRR